MSDRCVIPLPPAAFPSAFPATLNHHRRHVDGLLTPFPFFPPHQISCGRCSTCQPLDAALRAAGLSSVADAAASSPRWAAAFKAPGTMLTLLAPVTGIKAPADVDRHVLLSPPAWGNATWTPALLSSVDSVQTAAGDAVTVAGASLRGASGERATITKVVDACKSVVLVVDGAL